MYQVSSNMWTKPTAYIIRSRLGPCACPPLMFFLIINSLRYLNLADPKRPNLSQTEGLEVSSFIHDSAYNLALTFFSKKKESREVCFLFCAMTQWPWLFAPLSCGANNAESETYGQILKAPLPPSPTKRPLRHNKFQSDDGRRGRRRGKGCFYNLAVILTATVQISSSANDVRDAIW